MDLMPIKDRAREFVLKLNGEKIAAMGLRPEDCDSEFDLIDSGLLNSMSFLELLEKIEKKFSIELNFMDYDPAEFTSLGGLVDVVARSMVNTVPLPLVKNGIFFELMTHDDVDEVAACFSDYFRREEPLTLAMNISHEEFNPLVEHVCALALAEKSGIVCRDSHTRRLVGFSIGKDYGLNETFSEQQTLSEKFLPIFALHDELDNHYRTMHDIQPGESFLRPVMGIDRDYFEDHVGEGAKPCVNIVPELTRLTIDMAKHRGYQKVISHATSLFTQRLCKKYGFAEVIRVNYKTFSYRDHEVFRGIKWHNSCVLYEMNLS
jgi:acyl carrier protein